jgi:hypothetical protein
MSTLDGVFEISRAYESSVIDGKEVWTGIKAVDVNEAASHCPSCRGVVHSIFRYGRMMRYNELKVLERKYRMSIDSRLKNVDHMDDDAKKLKALESIHALVRRGPTQNVILMLYTVPFTI